MRSLKRITASAMVMAGLFSAAGATAQWSTSGNSVGTIFFGATNAADVKIRTNNVERARITSGGNVGINTVTTTIAQRLHLHQPTGTAIMNLGESSTKVWEFQGDGAEFIIYDPAAGNYWLDFSTPALGVGKFSLGPYFEVYNDLNNGGKFGFGTDITTLVGRAMVAGSVVPAVDNVSNAGSTTYRWDTVFACNGTIQTSDAKFKENIHDMNYGIGAVMRLHPVSFAWKDQAGGRQIGLLAQEIQPVIGEVVKEDEENRELGVFYSDFVPVLIKAVQDQQEEITDRVRENQQLREQMSKRTERIERMEALLKAHR